MASAIASLQTLFVLLCIQQQSGNKNLGATEMVLKHKFNHVALCLWVSERHCYTIIRKRSLASNLIGLKSSVNALLKAFLF